MEVLVQYRMQTLRLPITGASTFGSLKESISAEVGVPPEGLRVLFRGREKEDSATLASSGVQHKARLICTEKAEYEEVRGNIIISGTSKLLS
jgi:hypothetical protein